MKIIPSHIAILVKNVEVAAEKFKQANFNIGKTQVFKSEGTKEIYIEQDKSNSLLLMETIGDGPYKRALEKRGPGLHHIAIDVENLEEFIKHISGSGWLIHPISFEYMKAAKTIYLARPGFPALIEVHENKIDETKKFFINEIHITFDQKFNFLLKNISIDSFVKQNSKINKIKFMNEEIKISDLI